MSGFLLVGLQPPIMTTGNRESLMLTTLGHMCKVSLKVEKSENGE